MLHVPVVKYPLGTRTPGWEIGKHHVVKVKHELGPDGLAERRHPLGEFWHLGAGTQWIGMVRVFIGDFHILVFYKVQHKLLKFTVESIFQVFIN